MNHLAEIIDSSTTRFTAQCNDPDELPMLGAFVVVETPPGFCAAVVSEIRCGSADASRRPTAYGLPPEELHRQQPQLRLLLTTEFDACLVGSRDGERWRCGRPPYPPRLHHLVTAAPADAVAELTRHGDYLRTLSEAEVPDEVLAAAVRASVGADGAEERLIEAGRALARLMGDDYDRLQALMRRITS